MVEFAVPVGEDEVIVELSPLTDVGTDVSVVVVGKSDVKIDDSGPVGRLIPELFVSVVAIDVALPVPVGATEPVLATEDTPDVATEVEFAVEVGKIGGSVLGNEMEKGDVVVTGEVLGEVLPVSVAVLVAVSVALPDPLTGDVGTDVSEPADKLVLVGVSVGVGVDVGVGVAVSDENCEPTPEVNEENNEDSPDRAEETCELSADVKELKKEERGSPGVDVGVVVTSVVVGPVGVEVAPLLVSVGEDAGEAGLVGVSVPEAGAEVAVSVGAPESVPVGEPEPEMPVDVTDAVSVSVAVVLVGDAREVEFVADAMEVELVPLTVAVPDPDAAESVPVLVAAESVPVPVAVGEADPDAGSVGVAAGSVELAATREVVLSPGRMSLAASPRKSPVFETVPPRKSPRSPTVPPTKFPRPAGLNKSQYML
ncbi:hypothetical protein GY45DRAFT_778740 [Cubamyces sp. BRFM 1775]|nr:hypothetical protein GY45DRAFT_778740 [Cubamyces sp. BRFM 1775]